MAGLAFRPRPLSLAGRVAAPVLAVVFAFVAGAGLLAALGENPLAVYAVFFIEPFSSAYNVAEVANKTTTLAIIALGLAAGFRANIWNIGAEGQFIAGGIAASFVAVHWAESPLALPAMFVAGVAGGMAWAVVPAFLRASRGINEILTSLMLVYVAQLLLTYIVQGPLKDPQGFGFPQSPLFSESASLPVLVEGTRLFATLFLLPALMLAFFLFAQKTAAGFEMRVGGASARAARYAGFAASRPVWLSFCISGACAGLMGMTEVAGPFGQLTPVISPGYGFTAIIVAFLGRQTAVGIFFAAALMSLIYIGGENAQIEMGLPPSISSVFQGLILFCLLASDFFARHRVVWHGRAAAG